MYVYSKPNGAEKRVTAALIALSLGAFGFHKFYLGYTEAGLLMLLVSSFGLVLIVPTLIMAVVAITEGVSYLRKSDIDFVETYVYESKPWL